MTTIIKYTKVTPSQHTTPRGKGKPMKMTREEFNRQADMLQAFIAGFVTAIMLTMLVTEALR